MSYAKESGMAVPQVVQDVPRPKNTAVIPYGKDKAGFAVGARTCS